MQQLIAQGVEAVEHDAHHLLGILTAQCAQGRRFASLKCLLPLLFSDLAIVVIPEGLEDVLVVDE